jgi:ribosomal protein S18 acetylase RimI-like enzyme
VPRGLCSHSPRASTGCAGWRLHACSPTPSSHATQLLHHYPEFSLACGPGGARFGYVRSRYRYCAWTSALAAELEDVFVIREVRRHGVGRRLAEFAIARATERGCRTVSLNTNERNNRALALYR